MSWWAKNAEFSVHDWNCSSRNWAGKLLNKIGGNKVNAHIWILPFHMELLGKKHPSATSLCRQSESLLICPQVVTCYTQLLKSIISSLNTIQYSLKVSLMHTLAWFKSTSKTPGKTRTSDLWCCFPWIMKYCTPLTAILTPEQSLRNIKQCPNDRLLQNHTRSFFKRPPKLLEVIYLYFFF